MMKEMVKLDMKRWVADVIRQKEVAAVPVMTHPGIELNGNTVSEAAALGKRAVSVFTASA